MQRPEGFRSFAELLRLHDVATDTAEEIEMVTLDVRSCESANAERVFGDVLRDVRLFRARLHDMLERAVEKLLDGIADEVLARECAASPPDIERVVERALAKLYETRPLKVRVHPSDAAMLRNACIAVEPDAGLQRGDAVFEANDGTIASTLGTRLNSAIVEALTAIT